MQRVSFWTLWVLILAVTGSSAVLSGHSDWLYPPLVAALGWIAFRTKRVVYSRPMLLGFVVLAAAIIIPGLIRGDLMGSPGFIVLKLVISFLIIGVITGPRLMQSLDSLTAVVEVLVAISLVTWIVANAFPGLLRHLFFHEIGGDYLTLWNVATFQANGPMKFGFHRNQGLFWEPGVFAVVLILTFSLKVYVLNRKERMWLYVAGVVSSASMGGVILFAPIVVHSIMSTWMRSVRAQQNLMYFILLLSAAAASAILVFGDELVQMTGQVFRRDVGSDSSIETRLMDLVFGFKASFDSLLLGHGPDFETFYALTYIEMGTSKAGYMGGFTNSIVSMLYQFGLPFLAVYLLLTWMSCKAWFGRLASMFFMIWVGCLMLEPLFASILVFVFMLWPLSRARQTPCVPRDVEGG